MSLRASSRTILVPVVAGLLLLVLTTYRFGLVPPDLDRRGQRSPTATQRLVLNGGELNRPLRRLDLQRLATRAALLSDIVRNGTSRRRIAREVGVPTVIPGARDLQDASVIDEDTATVRIAAVPGVPMLDVTAVADDEAVARRLVDATMRLIDETVRGSARGKPSAYEPVVLGPVVSENPPDASPWTAVFVSALGAALAAGVARRRRASEAAGRRAGVQAHRGSLNAL